MRSRTQERAAWGIGAPARTKYVSVRFQPPDAENRTSGGVGE